jgi:hypothetical protein
MSNCDYCGRDLTAKSDYCTLVVHRSNQNVIFPIAYCDVACLAADWQASGDLQAVKE